MSSNPSGRSELAPKKQVGAFLPEPIYIGIAQEAIRRGMSRGDVLIEYAMKGGLEKAAVDRLDAPPAAGETS